MLRNQKGFTLVELIIVIVIIGILAAVAIPKFNELDTSAKEAACRGNKDIIRAAATSYYGKEAIDNNGQGAWPTALTDMGDFLDDTAMVCPVDNAGTYSIDGTTGMVTCSTCG
ncbi:prepilin-type N-terminal cleavage/methylation domain-containing protein [bacterium]|nr:prepilin-type N-terminal cleavage/methylation domain-containing protein [bacterium]